MAKSPQILIAGLFTTGGLFLSHALAIASVPKKDQEIIYVSPREYTYAPSIGLLAQEHIKDAVVEDSLSPPLELQLRANRQSYDARQKRFIAEGRVSVRLGQALLKADRIEFDRNFQTLVAKGRVRFKKGSQYFQASSFDYNLFQRTGELNDVYGVIDLEKLDSDLKEFSNGNKFKTSSNKKASESTVSSDINSYPNKSFLSSSKNDFFGSSSKEYVQFNPWTQSIPALNSLGIRDNPFLTSKSPRAALGNVDNMPCPPDLPPIPYLQPSLWSLTAWGGQMTDSDFGEAFIFDGKRREEYLFGIGLSRRVYQNGPLNLEVLGDFFRHEAKAQQGGALQSVPFALTPAQNFYEGIVGVGARVWLRPWLNIAFIEGVSYNTSASEFERTNRNKQSQFLNYLGAEIEALLSKKFSFVGRVHHRSGAFGTFGGVEGGSNAYLIGFRYRWGEENRKGDMEQLTSSVECSSVEKRNTFSPQTIDDSLDLFSLRKLNIFKGQKSFTSFSGEKGFLTENKVSKTDYSKLSYYEQEALRNHAIALIDQRIDSIDFKNSFGIQGKIGIQRPSKGTEEKNQTGSIKISQLTPKASTKIISGSVTRWRVQSSKVQLNPTGWKADKMSFTNDPFTPTQTRIDAYNVVAKEDSNTDILITSSKSRLLVEERINVPIVRSTRITRSEQIKNRWVVGIDQNDRDGFFIGRALRPVSLGKNYKLSLQPQFLLQRAILNKTNSYVARGSSVTSDKVSSGIKTSDLFGLKAKIRGEEMGFGVSLDGNVSTFNPDRFLDGSRYWANLNRSINVSYIRDVNTNIFGAYRDKVWNGSIGETEIYTAYGGSAEKSFSWNWNNFNNTLLIRTGVGNYQAERLNDKNLSEMWRTNLYSSLKTNYTIWKSSEAISVDNSTYRYSPVPVLPGLTFETNFSSAYFGYQNGQSQGIISLVGGPTLTLGTFTKPFLDYTKLSIFSGASLKEGGSPFAFDEVVDLAILGFGLSQQIVGPLVFNGGVEYNIDGGSDYYGKSINSNFELRWQRRSYDIGIFYSPEKGMGGISFHLNDFDFTGTGVPFLPYKSLKYME